MHLDLDKYGNPQSPLIAALAGRRIDLLGGSAAHPRQLIGNASRNVAKSLKDVLDALDSLPVLLVGGHHIDCDGLRDNFRRLLYDATELFDLYAQALPKRLEEHGAPKAALSDFRRASKRLRDPWATMCNKLKHDGSRIAYSRVASKMGPAQSHGYMFLSPRDGNAMLRDEQVHKPPERRTTFLKALHELTHAILRTDLNAAKIVSATPDGSEHAETVATFSFPFGESIQRLCRAAVYVSLERVTYDGLMLSGEGTVELVRSKAIPLIGEIEGATHFKGDGHTKSFSFQ